MAEESSKNKSAMLWVIVVAVILVIAIVAIYFLGGMTGNSINTQTQNSTGPSNPLTTPEAVQVVKAGDSALGSVLVGSNGMTLYVFLADSAGKSNCYGACAINWPPLLVGSGNTPLGTGISGTLGVTMRTDGTTQVTFKGAPLYNFIQDKSPGDLKGQGLNAAGGLWYAVSPSGQIITAPVPAPANSSGSSSSSSSSSSSGSSSSGGYGY